MCYIERLVSVACCASALLAGDAAAYVLLEPYEGGVAALRAEMNKPLSQGGMRKTADGRWLIRWTNLIDVPFGNQEHTQALRAAGVLDTDRIVAMIEKAANVWEAECNVKFEYAGQKRFTDLYRYDPAMGYWVQVNDRSGTSDRFDLNVEVYAFPGVDGMGAFTAGGRGVTLNPSVKPVDPDLALTAIHELGHALGLAHSDIEGVMMSGNGAGRGTTAYLGYSPSLGRMHLREDDIAGCRAIYGAPPATARTQADAFLNLAESVLPNLFYFAERSPVYSLGSTSFWFTATPEVDWRAPYTVQYLPPLRFTKTQEADGYHFRVYEAAVQDLGSYDYKWWCGDRAAKQALAVKDGRVYYLSDLRRLEREGMAAIVDVGSAEDFLADGRRNGYASSFRVPVLGGSHFRMNQGCSS